MSAMKDTEILEAAEATELKIVQAQLERVFGARGREFFYGVADAENWAALILWSGDERDRRIVIAGGSAADVIVLNAGAVKVHVQGPVRRATMDDYRRWREQRDAEDAS